MINIILYIIILALIHAKLELMIESKYGWALRLPCWRYDTSFIRFFFGKELTGYHFWLIILFTFIFHSPFLFIDWNIARELAILGTYFWYWLWEDFFWFVESQHYGIRNFKKGRIFWHKRWCFGIPVSYWELGGIGTLFLLLSKLLTH